MKEGPSFWGFWACVEKTTLPCLFLWIPSLQLVMRLNPLDNAFIRAPSELLCKLSHGRGKTNLLIFLPAHVLDVSSLESVREGGGRNPKSSFPGACTNPAWPHHLKRRHWVIKLLSWLSYIFPSIQKSNSFPLYLLDIQRTHILVEETLDIYFKNYMKAFQVHDITTLVECRDINVGVVKPILASVVVVIE